MKNIIIMGGSFNPPHKAHKRIVEFLTERFDKVIIVPCGTRPDKATANVVPIYHRMEMVNMAFSKIKGVSIDFYDFENDVYTPTYLVQKRYEKLFPDAKIWHLVGEDIIAGGCGGKSEIHRVWSKGTEIWNNLNFLVIVRPGYDAKHEDLPPNSEILEIKNIVGSGTLVRKRISDNKPINDLVDKEIEEYIKANNLYRSDTMKKKTKKEAKKQAELELEAQKLIMEFNHFKDKIFVFKYPEELFGELEGTTIDERMKSFKEKFRELVFTYAPDRYHHYNCQDLLSVVNEISRKIIELGDVAEKVINEGVYGERTNGDEFIISGKYDYHVEKLESVGDFSHTFIGTYRLGNVVEHVCIKMAKIADIDNIILDEDEIKLNNNSLSHEIDVLKHLDGISDGVFRKVRKQHFPIVMDDFMSPSGYVDVDIERRTMVTKCVPAYDFISLREKFPDGVPLYHACWILARMLSAVGHLHYNKVIHGNIHPEGVFVNPQDHNVTLADFEFSIVDYAKKDAKYIGATECYTAPEVYRGVSPHPRTDMYSIGISMIYLLGGDIEKRTLPSVIEMIDVLNPDIEDRTRGIEGIKSLILSLVNQHPLARSDDAWRAYHQLSDLRKMAFGKPMFVEFILK